VKGGMRNRLDVVFTAGPPAVGAGLATVPFGLEIFPEAKLPQGRPRVANANSDRLPVWSHLVAKANRMTPQPMKATAVR
jgi:hypothetical protein